MRPPVRTVRGNVLYGYGDERAAYYRVPTVSYDLFGLQAKKNELFAWAWFAHSVGADFSVFRVSRGYPADDYAQQTSALADARHARDDRWGAYLAEQQDRLQALAAHDPEVYVRVQLRVPTRRGRRAPDLLIGEAEAEAFRVLREQFPGARRASAVELVWLARRAAARGLCEPVTDQHWDPQPVDIDGKLWQPGHSHFARFFDYQLRRETHGLSVESEYGTSWQAVLAMGALPDSWDFPGNELMFAPLERFGAPVDAVCHVRWVPNEDMRTKARGRVLDADAAFKEESHQLLSWIPEENRSGTRDTEHYYATEPYPPGLLAARLLVVASSSREGREEAVSALRGAYGSGLRLERLPFRKQVEGFLDTLPAARGARVMDYADFLRLETFGSLMPHASHGAGPERGVFFGTTHRRVVRRDAREAARRKRSPAALYSGGLGSGKTLAAEKVMAEDVLAGSQGVASDPKPDWHLDKLPELAGVVHVIELAATAANLGLLDPLVITPAAWREDRAVSFLTDLVPGAPFTWGVLIREAVQATLEAPEPGCLKVIEQLHEAGGESAMIARHLRAYARGGLSALGFSDGDPRRVSVTHPLTIIRPSGLVLPSVDVRRSSYDHVEVISVAILKLIAVFAMRSVDADRSRHKRIALDEAHLFIGTPDGRRVIADVNTMGRAKNASLDLITQRMTPEVLELQELMATRYIFGQESEAQAMIGAQVVGLDPNDPDLIRRIMGMREGRCLYRDLDGRVVEMQVDLLPRWVRTLDTTPPDVDDVTVAAA